MIEVVKEQVAKPVVFNHLELKMEAAVRILKAIHMILPYDEARNLSWNFAEFSWTKQQVQLANILTMCDAFIDEETGEKRMKLKPHFDKAIRKVIRDDEYQDIMKEIWRISSEPEEEMSQVEFVPEVYNGKRIIRPNYWEHVIPQWSKLTELEVVNLVVAASYVMEEEDLLAIGTSCVVPLMPPEIAKEHGIRHLCENVLLYDSAGNRYKKLSLKKIFWEDFKLRVKYGDYTRFIRALYGDIRRIYND